MSRKRKHVVIRVLTSKNTIVGFLSNHSKHGFKIKGKRWFTVEHYIQAKKFSGTEYEEKIRRAPTVFQAIKLAKNSRKYGVYSKDFIDREKILLKALKAKFTQNPHLRKKLLNTRDAKLIIDNDLYTGKILENIRKNMRGIHHNSKRNNIISVPPISDFKSGQLTSQEILYVKKIFQIGMKVANAEGWNKFIEDMLDDTLITLLPHDLADISFKYSKQIFNEDYISFPNWKRVSDTVNDIISNYDSSQKYSNATSLLIAGIIKWIRDIASQKQKNIVQIKFKNITINTDVKLSKGQKWYRTHAPRKPLKIKRERLTNKKNTSKRNKKHIIPHKLTIRDIRGGDFYVVGKTLSKYSIKLLAIGGTYPHKFLKETNKSINDTTKIKFSSIFRKKVKDFIDRTLTKKDHNELNKSRLLRNKITDFIDMGVCISRSLKINKIDVKMIDIAIFQMFGQKKYQVEQNYIKQTFETQIQKILSSRKEYLSYSLSPQAFKKLDNYISYMVLQNYKNDDQTSLNSDIPQNLIKIFKSLAHISEIFMKNYSPEINIRFAKRIWLTLVPQKWRIGISQFMNEVDKKIQVCNDQKNIEKQLKIMGINDEKYSLDSVRLSLTKYMKIDKYTNLCIAIFAAGAYYTIQKISEKHKQINYRINKFSSLIKLNKVVKKLSNNHILLPSTKEKENDITYEEELKNLIKNKDEYLKAINILKKLDIKLKVQFVNEIKTSLKN